jgi:ABC-2 type transport system permease protein
MIAEPRANRYVISMTRRLDPFLSIARLTAVEALRQPLAFLLFLSAVALTALLPLILTHTLGESIKFVRDSSLALLFLSGLLMAAQTACAALSTELRSGTAAVVLSKPISRSLFFLAKFSGIAVVMLLFCSGLLMAILLAVRTAREPYVTDWWAAAPLLIALVAGPVIGGLINYLRQRPFASNAFLALWLLLAAAFLIGGTVHPDPTTGFGPFYDPRIVQAVLLLTMAILVLAGISAALATRLTALPTLSWCGALFLLGLLSDYAFGRWTTDSLIATLLYHTLPNWQHFWVVDALQSGVPIPLTYLGLAGLYALCYLSGVLAIGAWLFQRREVAV